MSLKVIELQLALPKTQTVGQIQKQIQQTDLINQSHLKTQTKKIEAKRKRKTEELKKSLLQEHNTLRSPKNHEQTKGRFIDLEL
ncbi:hypothetical protein [Tepidibacillus fermentans]|uniref:Uncharacterized protein n=1 Tax=Tepidibacillus fermentans TaxID=1281767 RepID=A0A4R3KI87_9BACI|nr:hypothetical protein [Tepidibacillus fermentans]TCS82966.1 hypothetical protein EDD72_10749 [Tepidibacillus fermentans]